MATDSVTDETVFRCFRIHDSEGRVAGRVETCSVRELPAAEVLVEAVYSDINYKDALAATGKGKIIRDFPLIGGIDVSGVVAKTSDQRFKVGESVVVTGCGLGERHDGGFSEYVSVPGEWVIPLPEDLTLKESMIVGTAGFTAAQAIDRMELNGQTPAAGPILVTGATGGVGSFAVSMLRQRGYRVIAFTGKRSSEPYLRGLGATEVLFRDEVEFGQRPLEKARFAGAIDSLGGEVLSWLTRVVEPCGNIASIGLAMGVQLETTVMPFILRGINLLGIDSVNVPRDVRLRIWNRIATDLRPPNLDQIVAREVTLDELHDTFGSYIDGTVVGRTLVEIRQQVDR